MLSRLKAVLLMSLYSPRSLYSLPQLGGLREGGLQRTPVFVGGGRLPGLEGVGGLRLRDALRQSHQSCTSKSTTSFVIVCFVLGCCRKKQVCFCFFSHLQDLTDPVMMMFEQPDEEAEEMQEDRSQIRSDRGYSRRRAFRIQTLHTVNPRPQRSVRLHKIHSSKKSGFGSPFLLRRLSSGHFRTFS